MKIPEAPADLYQLWRQAATLEASRLPSWLSAEDADSYRYVGPASSAGLMPAQKDLFAAELRELEEVGLVIDRDPQQNSLHHLYLGRPRAEAVWSIGIYQGDSPLALKPDPDVRNPVLTRQDVTDVAAVFVADPFMLRVQNCWYMFFEVMNWRANKGEIGLATSDDGRKWTYRQIVLAEPFHLSYPCVFEWGGEYFMIPESYQARAIRLYKARQFPCEWSLVGSLLEEPYLADASVFRHAGLWWLFTETNPDHNDTLRLFSAADLAGPWREHPQSPIIHGNPHTARPAGKVLNLDGRLIRFAQSCEPCYGTDVRAFEITQLTATDYREQPLAPRPLLGPSGHGWNAAGMHHIDPHRLGDARWLACVDGWYEDGKQDSAGDDPLQLPQSDS